MLDNIHSLREWFKISQVQFGFIYPEQLRRMSVVQIDNAVVYDGQKRPMRRGLYDPLMGVSPNEREAVCLTCGHTGLQCSGHPGHIELILPAYNPLIIDVLLRLLKMNCFQCHRFRIRETIKQDYVVMLQLLRGDRIKEAYQYYQVNVEEEKRRLQKLEQQPQKESEEQREEYREKVKQCNLRIEFADRIKKECRSKGSHATTTSIQLFSQFTKMLHSLTQSKCPYQGCKQESKRVKKEGASKIFLIDREHNQDEKQHFRKKSRDSSRGESTQHPTSTKHPPQPPSKRCRQRYMNPKQIYNQLRKIWHLQHDLVEVMFGNNKHGNSFTMFFLNTVFVPPSRFRPQSKVGEEKYLHDHTTMLGRIVQINTDIRGMVMAERREEMKQASKGEGNKEQSKAEHNKKWQQLKTMRMGEIKQTQWFGPVIKKLKNKPQFINKWLQLQDSINCFIDSTKSSKLSDKDFKGVRQILQKKEGLFRMKMMGKRVNFAARSVISPDPSLNTDQVGIPMFMSKKLTFPEHINQYNLDKLQSYIINGKKYPGANFIQENGKITRLDCLSQEQRVSHARNLWNNHQNKIVYRHLMTGDNVLFNRQPTLHKAGLMAHRVKVLPKQSTLRMNYANCKSYNADFDGDEMNLHALQTYMAKAQAELCMSDMMYENPTNGKPLRQIMQDGVLAAVYLSMRDTFFGKSDYSQLLYQATFSLFTDRPKNLRLFLLHPAIAKPQHVWTGKQLISNVIKVIVEYSDLRYRHEPGLCMRSTTKVPKSYMKGYEEEHEVVFIDNQFLKGLIDKNQVGSNSEYGLLHSFTELYGEAATGKLITALNKLFLNYMQMHGFTCGLDDLMLKKKVNKQRREMLQTAHQETVVQICKTYNIAPPKDISYMGRSKFKCDSSGVYMPQSRRTHVRGDEEIVRHLQYKIVNQQHALDELDAQYKHHLNKKSSQVMEVALCGFMKQFPLNNFSMMTLTGAKGSNVNHSQVSVMLGQQQLQGKRVPVMITGKTLPSFPAYDPNPRSAGFVSDRFLTGLRTPQFYFHCMAGRQGLIDTAVKTSRSGYLQRCLMKHLQSLKVEYDCTVRDSDGSIIQFLYGEDSLNPAKDKFFSKIQFLKNNLATFKSKFNHQQFRHMLKTKEVIQFKQQQSQLMKNVTIQQMFSPASDLGAISQKGFSNLLRMKADVQLQQVFGLKYKFNMIQAGEAVGCTAAQSIGQPSTQMTLNTFHLAGHGGVNLTLGIPRLRELLITCSDKIKTPIMELHFVDQTTTKVQAGVLAKKLEKVSLVQLVSIVQVQEWKQLFTHHQRLLSHNDRKRYYKITLHYEAEQFMRKQYAISYGHIQIKVKNVLVVGLLAFINRVKKRNQLRAEIKRSKGNQKDMPEEEEQDNEKESNQQEDKEDNIIAEEPQKLINYNSPQFGKLTFNSNSCEIIIKVSLSLKKFLMTKVIQRLLSTTIMKEITGINSVIVLQKKILNRQVPYIQTEGVNFDILEQFDFINRHTVRSNDIQAFSKKFGIQAARSILVSEIVGLFGAYGVTVDYRHLYLIGDYVTFGGNIKAMNRNWMNFNPSPFLRMTFETSVKFITQAAMRCEVDHCKTPSSKIILGQCPQLGTGMHDLLMQTNY